MLLPYMLRYFSSTLLHVVIILAYIKKLGGFLSLSLGQVDFAILLLSQKQWAFACRKVLGSLLKQLKIFLGERKWSMEMSSALCLSYSSHRSPSSFSPALQGSVFSQFSHNIQWKTIGTSLPIKAVSPVCWTPAVPK